MEEYTLFCTTCGGKMDPDSAFCPACGASATAAQGANPHAPQRNSAEQWEANSKLKTATMLLMLGTVVQILLGLLCIAMIDVMADVYDTVYTNISLQELQDIVKTAGYVLIGSGVICLVSGVIVMKRISWVLAFVLTLIATALGFYSSFIGGFLGILCLYYIYKYKAAFA